jgi:hypothetical protein
MKTEHALMKDKNPNIKYGIPMTRMNRKLKALKKKIAERHRNIPEENEITVDKKDLKKTVRSEDPEEDNRSGT